jgi:hypothetical protein
MVGTKSNPESIFQSKEKEMEMAMVFHPVVVVNLTEETPYQGGFHRPLVVEVPHSYTGRELAKSRTSVRLVSNQIAACAGGKQKPLERHMEARSAWTGQI